MTRDLSKDVMKRSPLRNKCLNDNSEENRNRYTKKTTHFYVFLLRKTNNR